MADDRTYIRVHDGLDEHPKVEGLSDAGFRLLLTSWFYCSRNRTDGRIADGAWRRRGTSKARRELFDAGLADQHDGYVEMHDYLAHQRSAEEIRLLRETRGDTGAYGNHIRWHVVKRKPKKGCEHCFPGEAEEPPDDSESVANPIANGIASAIAKPSQTDRKPIASTEAEAEAEAEVLVDSFRGERSVSDASDSNEPPRCSKHRHTAVADLPNCWACGHLREEWLKARNEVQAAVVRETQRCLVHALDYTTVCPGCRADEIAADEESA